MVKTVDEMISKYNEAIDAVDWDAAAAEWAAQKSTFIANYTGITGINPRVAAKYKRKVEKASYRKPDPAKMKTRYASKMRGG
jgi:hypothetical protein